jgi:hypothetical protein
LFARICLPNDAYQGVAFGAAANSVNSLAPHLYDIGGVGDGDELNTGKSADR